MEKKAIFIKATFTALFFIFLFPGVAQSLEPPKKPKDYPKRRIEYVVRWGAGGAAGGYARHFAKTIKDKLGLNFAVVNMTGASGMNAIPYFMEQPADGYTILNMDTIFIVGQLQGKTKYRISDFMHICRVQFDTEVLFVRPNDNRFPDIKTMIQWAKDHPKTLNIATEGAGALGDLILGKLEKLAGFTANHVPYAQFGARVAALVGGHVDVLYEEAGDVLPYVKDGQAKPILVFAKKRIDRDPYRITCTGDFGWDHEMALWRSIAVKKGTPAPVARYLEQVFKYYHETPEGKEFEKKLLLDLRPGFMDWETTEKFVKGEEKSLREIMKNLGIPVK